MEPMTFQTTDELALEVRVPAGIVEVRASDDPGRTEARVAVTGEQDPDDMRIRFESRTNGRDRLVVEHREPTRFGWGSGRRDLRVTIDVPSGVDVDAETASADLDVSGWAGTLAFRSGSGAMSFADAAGDVSAKVASGEVRGGEVAGDLMVTSASGDVRVGSVAGSTAVKTASGDVDLDRVARALQVVTVSGDVSIGAIASGEVNVRSVSGDIEIGVDAGAIVWLDLITTSGDASSELDSSAADEEEARSIIRAVSVSGDVRVRRAALRR
jgi:DUF4097 and DUF4098 domain-containing protein YvlB